MELEDLKTTWESVKPHIDSQLSENVVNESLSKRNDIKTRLLTRARWDGIFTIICLILMAFSPFWSPMKLPYWWLIVFCLTIFIAIIYGIRRNSTQQIVELIIMSTNIHLRKKQCSQWRMF